MVPWHQPAPSHPQPLARRAVSPQPSCPRSGAGQHLVLRQGAGIWHPALQRDVGSPRQAPCAAIGALRCTKRLWGCGKPRVGGELACVTEFSITRDTIWWLLGLQS